ncbi:AsnC family transcriptional regulator [Dechloromonas sp. TW-R-39-2]|uniref:siroheme decarboxylase subunit beta n=1 Tax=Dechloromonas sp. TW-R-39-2 TaxID=2654218 RepID=UPI00193DD44F|nr:AsnC family transcriptional regulator [Dechloromonas sp. TW-R-39-2]
MDTVDRQLILATQGGLPLVARPYAQLAEQLGLSEADIMLRLQGLLDRGLIRRIGVVPNHYAIGWTANGMTVWNVPDDKVDELGGRVGALPFVTHCYRRPRALPAWPYNLFAMVHGSSREECSAKADDIRRLLGDDCLGNDVLYSTRILKKTGLRIGG